MAVGQDTECGERSKTSYVRPADEEDFTVIGEVNSFNHFQASKKMRLTRIKDQLNIWCCFTPGYKDKLKAKKHPKEWEEELETFRRDHLFVTKKCGIRFATKEKVDRHQRKMH